jgi:hypothetical protein
MITLALVVMLAQTGQCGVGRDCSVNTLRARTLIVTGASNLDGGVGVGATNPFLEYSGLTASYDGYVLPKAGTAATGFLSTVDTVGITGSSASGSPTATSATGAGGATIKGTAYTNSTASASNSYAGVFSPAVVDFDSAGEASIYFRTPASLTSLRLFVGGYGAGWQSMNVDNPATGSVVNYAGVLRYSASAADTGFVCCMGKASVSQTCTAQVAAIAANTLYHVRTVRTSGGDYKTYLNGSLVCTQNSPAPVAGVAGGPGVAITNTAIVGAGHSVGIFGFGFKRSDR